MKTLIPRTISVKFGRAMNPSSVPAQPAAPSSLTSKIILSVQKFTANMYCVYLSDLIYSLNDNIYKHKVTTTTSEAYCAFLKFCIIGVRHVF